MKASRKSTPPNPDASLGGTQPTTSPLRVGIVLLDQFTLLAFAGLIDALRLAADYGGQSRQIHASWTIMSVGGESRQSSSGAIVGPNATLLDPAGFDYIAVCGGNDYLNSAPAQPELLEYLRRAAASRVRLIGVCTGTFTIAQTGLVGTRRVCVNWNVFNLFKKKFPNISASTDHLYLDEGDLITCAGSTAAIDLGLYLIARHCGRDKARQSVRHMILQNMRPARLPQPHFYTHLDGVADLRVHQAVHFMEQRIDAPPTVDAIARYVGVGARQLERLFHAAIGRSPTAFQRQMRLEYGKWLLENGTGTVTQVAFDCGFADASHFSREFHTLFKIRPSDIKKSRSTQGEGGGTETSMSEAEVVL